MSSLGFIEDELAALAAHGRLRIARTVEARRGAEVVVDGRTLVNFAANDYLGLALDPRLATAAAAAERELGTGAGASRLISGHTVVTAELERALAAWVGRPSARLFNSGYSANTGLLPCVANSGDVIFSDERNHASLIDGCRLARATIEIYRHADLDDLARRLRTTPGRRRFVVTESIFSMDGDLAPLEPLVTLAHAAGAVVIVDDAHALGVVGPGGAGLGAAAGADIVVGTLGKSVGAAGAFVAGPAALADLLWNRARTLVFSTGMTIGTQAAALAGVAIAAGGDGDERRARLQTLRVGLGRRMESGSAAAIVPVILGSDRAATAASARLEELGFWVPAIRPPTVAEGTARLRITLSAAHSAEQVAALSRALDDLGV
ncbi:MAG: 8-amino-7-oxononanoate synthase [Myxococcales bacterium]|nr:8-amino-7-oxononanoate synthase [Myxococcales bacterium]